MDKPENKSVSNSSASNPGASSLGGARSSIHSARAVPVSGGVPIQPAPRTPSTLSQSISRGPVRAPVGRASGSYQRSGVSQPIAPGKNPSASVSRVPSSNFSSDRSLIKPSSDSASGEVNNSSGQNPAVPSTPNANAVSSASAPSPQPSADGIAETVMLSKDKFDENGNPIDGEDLTEEPELDVAPAATLPTGMIIDGRYEIQGVLGTGGFATVYRAHHISLDNDVALKVMDTKKGVDATYSERFFREAKIAAKIRHNNVVTVYDYGHIPETDQPYIAMEMLHGRDLSHEITDVGPLSPKRAFILFRPVLEALSVGHKLGIVHKDLKPENLYLIDPGGTHETMKILDFGVARVNSSEVAKLTTAGQLLGTPRYLAPEYIKSQQVSPAIDVYQMALIISEALTGIPAVTGDPFHAMMLHCSGKLQISGFLLEGRLGEVFRKAIAINPEDRYPDCETFAKALDTVADLFSSNVPLQGGAPQIVPDAGMASFAELSPSGQHGMMSGSYATPKSSKKLVVLIILFMLVLLGVGGGIFYKFNKQKKADLERLEQERLAAEEAAKRAMEQGDPNAEFVFSFKTTPEKASVRVKGGSTICESTPCSYTFKRSSLPATILFSLKDYDSSELIINEGMTKDQKGSVDIKLEKPTTAPVDLVFSLNFSPKNATVSDDNGEIENCKASPCPYTFNTSKKFVTLTFTAPQYKPMTVLLTEGKYKESPEINIKLDPIRTNRPKDPPVVTPQPKPDPKPDPQPQEPKKDKPKIKIAGQE